MCRSYPKSSLPNLLGLDSHPCSSGHILGAFCGINVGKQRCIGLAMRFEARRWSKSSRSNGEIETKDHLGVQKLGPRPGHEKTSLH